MTFTTLLMNKPLTNKTIITTNIVTILAIIGSAVWVTNKSDEVETAIRNAWSIQDQEAFVAHASLMGVKLPDTYSVLIETREQRNSRN
jgi:hypothetical protein